MAAVKKKELLVWYVITLKLRETVESRLPRKSTSRDKIVPDNEPRTSESEWVVSIEEKLERFCQDNLLVSWESRSIHRFPRYLKYGDDKAWLPQIVSLGPYHHGAEHLRHMERHKWRCLHRILERSEQKIGLYLHSVKKVERRARACYEETIFMSTDDFVEMMVLDGCFVIELLRGFYEGFEELGYHCKDPVFSTQGMYQIRRDMIMLENQIPFFILDRLLGLQLSEPNQKGRVATLAFQFFGPLLLPDFLLSFKIGWEYDPLYDHGRVHFLEAFQRDFLSMRLQRSKTQRPLLGGGKLIPRLTELREAGIKIRRSFALRFLDIRFRDGTLSIPFIKIHEGTRSLFLNLIAFGQSHLDCRDLVTSYIIFMHNLISSPEDVRCLCEDGVMEHSLDSDAEVVDLFNQLCRRVPFDSEYSYLSDLCLKVRGYFSDVLYLSWRACLAQMWNIWRARLAQKLNAWRTILKSKYFDNPWSIISVVAAFILLMLTFIQALYAIYGYYRPHC